MNLEYMVTILIIVIGLLMLYINVIKDKLHKSMSRLQYLERLVSRLVKVDHDGNGWYFVRTLDGVKVTTNQNGIPK